MSIPDTTILTNEDGGARLVVRYRERKQTVEAVQLTPETWPDLVALVGNLINPANPGRVVEKDGQKILEVDLPTLGGMVTVVQGDYVTKNAVGALVVLTSDEFAKAYEEDL